ncbi:cytochrome c [Robbsia sp. KACC 23696]|uniref:cytochrome c n=1 Tax=Robbsia sp. KACC 23696 TaxID=3149231 RepID=UPI00325A604D
MKAWGRAKAIGTLAAALGMGAVSPLALGQPASAVSATVIPAAAVPLPATASVADADLIRTGQYLATAADCAACHTAQGGKPFAGGYPVNSPMGVIYSTNITPAKQGGIGDYTEADFARAVRSGVRRDGVHLYPAMPYTDYTALTDKDIHALYAYFHTAVAPVDVAAPRTALTFPFNVRASMALWNVLYLHDKRFVPDPSKTDQVNRGAYLVGALEHCAACHTPRDTLMGQSESNALAGSPLGSWYAPNITSDPVSGIGAWSDKDLTQYLRTGSVPGKAQAGGPMAEAIDHSLQYLSDEDSAAIVAYLKQTRPISNGETVSRAAQGQPLSEAAIRGNDANPPRGFQLFSGSCAACHQANGAGLSNGDYPSLFHNTATGSTHPENLIATILFGLHRDAAGKPAYMPAFGPNASFTDRLTDADVADVANYVLTQFGNAHVAVTADDVATVRRGGPPVLLARLGSYAIPALLVIVIAIVLLIGLWRARRKT